MSSQNIKLPLSCEWVCRIRDYAEERQRTLFWEEVTDHPLKPLVVTVTETRVARKVMIGSAGSSTGSSTPISTTQPFQGRGSGVNAQLPIDPLSSALEGGDPLSQFMKEQEGKDAELDPLSKMAAEFASEDGKWDTGGELRPLAQQNSSLSSFTTIMNKTEPWSAKKAAILNRFTTSEKLSIVTSFLSSGGGGSSNVGSPTSSPASVHVVGSMGDKVRNRLEQLDELEEGVAREVHGGLSQGEYMARIGQLGRELQLAWSQDQRVRALKIAIQCSKLLVDTGGINFYPSKFVLITDILDNFGCLVYDRLRSKAGTGSGSEGQQSSPLTPDLVPESAKETCKNWFYKIASIRELVPRLYVEMAILKSYAFLTSSEFSDALIRLTRMIRGIGDPLVAAYARCYLCRVGPQLLQVHHPSAPSPHKYLKENYYDFIASYKQVCVFTRTKVLALEWILQGVAADASCQGGDAEEKALCDVLERCKEIQNGGLVLNSIMSTFKPALIASKSLQFIQMISGCDGNGFPQHLLMKTLGWCLSHDSAITCLYSDAMEPREYHLKVLNAAWRLIGKLHLPIEYLTCALAWIHYPLRHLSMPEVNTLLGDVIKHLGHGTSSNMNPTSGQPTVLDNLQPQLLSFLQALLADASDLEALFTLDNFLPFLDLFKKESVRLEACKAVMESFCRSGPCEVSDPVLVSALMYLCRALHDSVNEGQQSSPLTPDLVPESAKETCKNWFYKIASIRELVPRLYVEMAILKSYAFLTSSALTIEDDKRHISRLICSVITRVEAGAAGDFEARLSFLAVNRLSVNSRKVVRGHHTRKTAAFVRACSAYAHITVPSLPSVSVRLSLFLLSADACFKAALSLLPELPPTMDAFGEGSSGKQRSSEPFLVSYLSQFLSTLLVVPDPPEQGVLYLLRGLLNVVQHYSWLGSSSNTGSSNDAGKKGANLGMSKAVVYMNVLQMLSSAAQETYLYGVDKVDSNDVLYGGDPKFVQELERICTRVLGELLAHLQYLREVQQWKQQSLLAFELFHRVVIFGDVGDPGMLDLALSLWQIAHSIPEFSPDQKFSARTLEYLRRKGSNSGKKGGANSFSVLVSKLQHCR
ncbi:hypothetical protein J437_LFUL007594 [Ladona fulva]|uniref:Uncharacterized protein n=1 Tax=Ladona fulva TaxID=123851 RepID=A0A8K0P2V1_LADFU|nr:hypothetical protein J437_LFUL007594 [Ladona fulva]